jgi:hypothetical protein
VTDDRHKIHDQARENAEREARDEARRARKRKTLSKKNARRRRA